MPNGDLATTDFEKKLQDWEKKTQLYQEQAQTSQKLITEYGRQLDVAAQPPTAPSFVSARFAEVYAQQAYPLIIQDVRPKLTIAANDLERSDFFARLYGEVPFAISAGQVSSADEVLSLLKPPATLTADELAEVRSTILDMVATITQPPGELPLEAMDLEEIDYPELIAPAPITRSPITLHQLSTQEIIKSLTIPTPPESAMSKEQWEEFLRLKGYTDEDIDMEQQILAEQLIASWQDRSNQMDAFRTGIAEMPDYKVTDILKEMTVQPGLALAEVAMIYFEHVSMPLAGKNYKRFIPDIEAEYQRFKTANPNVSDREALVHAWRAWDAPFEGAAEWILKYMLMEGLVDPLTYVGWGIATKLTRPIPYAGRLVGAAERGIQAVFEAPFDVIKFGVRKIPKTLTQRATMAQHQASQYVERYLTKATGRHLTRMSMKDFTAASERAIKYALNNPQLEDNIALAGREMLKHAPIDEALTKDWASRLGTTLRSEDITKVTVENLENIFEDMFMRKLITPREASGQLLKILNVGEMTDDALKLAQRILETRVATIQRGAMAFTTAKTPLAAMRSLASKNFKTYIVAERSMAALARKEAGAYSTLLCNIDLKLQAIWRDGIDRWVVRPFAESYLTFGMYGPMNVLEDYIRSTLGGVIPRRMNIEAWEKISIGLRVDPELKRYGISEMIGPLAREGPQQEWNNWILQLAALGQKNWADKIYKTLVRIPGAYGMDVRRNFMSKRYLQLLAEAGGDQFQALAKAGPRNLPKLADRKLIKDLEATVYSLRTTGNPDAIRGAKELFTRRRVVRNEVNNILKEHPNLPNTARDYIMKAYDEDAIFSEAAESIERTITETRNILLDDFIRGPEVATQQYHQLADFLTALEVRNPQEMASAIQAVYKMSEIYGALPDQIIAQATIRSRGLPLAERRATFDADFDRVYMFLDNAGADIDRVIAKIRTDVPRLAGANYQDASTRLFDTMVAKREFATEFRAQNMATRHEIFAGLGKKDLTPEFWDNFYLQMNNEYRLLNVRMAELDGQLVRAIEEMNVAAGAKITPRSPVVVRDRALAPQDIATLLGVRGDDISRSLLDVLTVQNNKEFFVTYVQAMTRSGDVGFTKESIGAVYDQISYSLRVAPESMSWITSKQIELDAVRKEIHSLYNSKMLPDEEIASIGRYIDDTADAVENLMYETPAEVMYHGTTAEAVEQISKEGFITKRVYLSSSSSEASAMGKNILTIDTSRIKRVYTLDFSDPKVVARAAPEAAEGTDEWFRYMEKWSRGRVDELEAAGYDAVRIVQHGPSDAFIGPPLEQTIVFKPAKLSIPSKNLKPEYANFDDLRQSAMDEAHKWYYKEYPDYTNANAFDAMMKTIYPYWTYESQRWFWLPRAFVRHPGIFTTFERWQNNSDYGYIHIPGTSVDINPFRGTIFGTLTTRLTRRDFPEYYDSLGATRGLVEFNDYLSRFGFYPGAHIGIPLAMMGGLEQQMGETMPAIWKTPLNALIAALPESESVKWLSEHIFSDRFREYMTILEVNKRGYRGAHIWTKIKENIPLTEEEQAVWDSARGEAALHGVFFEQFGLFRLRTDEQYRAYEESSKVIEEMTGYTAEQQDWLRRHGYRLWDMVGGISDTNQAILQELEAYKWIGTVTPLLPSRQQLELRRLDLDWDDVMTYADTMQQRRLELQQEFLSGKLGPRDYIARLQDSYSGLRTYIEKKMEDNPLMTLEGRKEYFKKYGISFPVQHPSKELRNLFFSIELNTEAIDPETGEIYIDWDSFFAQRAAIEDAMPEEIKAEWEATLSKNTTRIEGIRQDVSNTYFRKYYDVWEASLALYPENEQKLIEEFLYLERTGQQLARQGEIKSIISAKTGNQLISSFRSDVADNRAALRYANPNLDAWLFYWGRTTSFKTPQAEAIYNQISIDTGRRI